ncbi:uncharacterized protein LOC114122505 [Aphis gossypii]|uniref:THAP-type domain-containing protein n=1 Tax=Aphis gossypii TaxID=80765 RepID=A0A9P0J979_APHGO|nr:uncharacterized protein LOC114122505 [Aphis gossypii]CAH1731500.1 unnamed protein product [Aphis gossypii]
MTEKLSKLGNNCVVCKRSPKKYQAKYTSSNMSLHSFPSRPERRQIWLKRCGLTDEEVLPFGKICSFHFEPTCFKSSKLKRRLLHLDAVPTIFVEDCIKETNVPLKNNKGKPKKFKKNEIPLQINEARDVSVNFIDSLRFPPSDVSLTRSTEQLIEGQNGQAHGISATKIITNQNCFYCNEALKHVRNIHKILSKKRSSYNEEFCYLDNIIAEVNKKKLLLESLRKDGKV